MSQATIDYPNHNLLRRIRDGLAPAPLHEERRAEAALWGHRFSSQGLKRYALGESPKDEVVIITTSAATLREGEVNGIARRLMAGVYSFEARAFGRPSRDDFPIRGGEVWFDATSNGGWWSQRGWRVSARLDWSDAVVATDALVSVRSASSGVWTTFDGEAVNRLIEGRIQTLLAQVGFFAEVVRQGVALEEVDPREDQFQWQYLATIDVDGDAVGIREDGFQMMELFSEKLDTKDFIGSPVELKIARIGWEYLTR